MHMRHALPRRLAVLHRYIERIRAVDALESALHARHGLEEVGDFGGREVGEVRAHVQGRDEDVARQQGFEVYEREGERGGMEDLPGCSAGGREVLMGATGGYGTCEVTEKGPNLIREPGKGGIVVVRYVWFERDSVVVTDVFVGDRTRIFDLLVGAI